MNETLSEALHSRLDSMGAPPRESAPAVPEPAEIAEPDLTPAPIEESAQGQPEPDDALDENPQGAELDGDTDAPEPVEIPDRYKAAELAEAIGWEPAELYNRLDVPIGNGETLSLGEIKDRFDGLAAQQAEVQQARTQLEQQQQQLLQAQTGVSEEVQEAQGQIKSIEAQYSQVDWDALGKSDPGKAALLKQQFATAYAQAERGAQEAQTKFQQQQQQIAQQQLVEHDRRLMELVPEWKEHKTFTAELPQIQQYLVERGFAPQEIAGIYHAGARAVARDAWLWNQHKGQVKQAQKKMRQAPKPVMRPGQGAPAKQQRQDRRANDLEARAIRTGRNSDKLDALRAIVQTSRKR